jgi:hypothetical protein
VSGLVRLFGWAPELLLFLCGISEFGYSVLNLYLFDMLDPRATIFEEEPAGFRV